MPKIVKTTTIQAPVTDVWTYLNDPMNLLEIWPSMHQIENVKVDAEGRQAYDWTYRMAGIPFHGHSETIDLQPERLFVMRSESGIPNTFRWSFEDVGGKTKLTVEVDYDIPGKLVQRLAEPFVRRVNEKDAETLLENLKARLETGGEIRAGAGPTEARP